MTQEEKQQQIIDQIREEGRVSDLISSIQTHISILSSRLEDIRLEYPNISEEQGESAVSIFTTLEALHSQLSVLTPEA